MTTESLSLPEQRPGVTSRQGRTDGPAPERPARVRRADHVAARFVEGELVLYDARRQRVHVLNATAAATRQLCDGEHTCADIVRALSASYPGESKSAIEQDVVEVLDLFSLEELLHT
jgi:Coenzyme PQQ synthesis protein D (PqqD)